MCQDVPWQHNETQYATHTPEIFIEKNHGINATNSAASFKRENLAASFKRENIKPLVIGAVRVKLAGSRD